MKKLYIPLNIQRFAATLTVSASVLSQDISGNYSIVRITATIKRTGGTTYWEKPNYRTLTINCDGQTSTQSTTFKSGSVGETVSYYADFTIYHNNDGTKYIEFTGSIPKTGNLAALSGSGNATLPAIPRQPNYSWTSYGSVTETSARLYAGIDTHGLGITGGGWDISTDGGSTWTYYSGDVTDKTLTGLTPNTQYWFRGYCTTAGGGNNSNWASFITADYPKVNSLNDIRLRLDETFTIGFYNPLQRTFNFDVISNVNNSIIYSETNVTGTSASINMSSVMDDLYETIPNSTEGTYYVKVTYNGNIRNSGNKKYIIDADTCKPIMSTVGYEDVNSTTLALTNDDQKLIMGYSTIQVTVADGNKATPRKYATITGYKIKNGDYISPNIIPEEEGEDIILTCPATSGIIEVYAVDSRGQSGVYQIVNTTIINYTPIAKNQSPIAERTDSSGTPNGVGEYVKITLDGTFWNNNFGDVNNSITSITYNYANAQNPSQTTPGTTIVTATTSNNTYSVSQLILGDTTEGFDVANSYIINVTVNDELSSITFTMTLGSGTPHIAYADNGIAIKQMYDTNDNSALQVAGDASIAGKLKLNSEPVAKMDNNGTLYLGANNNNLCLRPNGVETWQGQTYFKTDGSFEQNTGIKEFISKYDGSYYWQFQTDANEFQFNKQVVAPNIWTDGTVRCANGVDTAGGDIKLSTPSSSSNDSGDLVWYYGNGQEKTRIWTDNTPDGFSWLPKIRTYNTSGSLIREGRLLSNMVLEISNQNILDLEPGLYFKEGSSGWTSNGWPVDTWHATLIVIGFNSGGGYGWKTLFCHDNSNNKVYVRSQQWSSWSSWKEL